MSAFIVHSESDSSQDSIQVILLQFWNFISLIKV